MTSNTQGLFHFYMLLAQKQHFDTLYSYRDNESSSPNNSNHKSQKTATATTPIAAVSESAHDSSIPNNPVHSDLAPQQTERASSHENPSVLNIC